MLILFFYIIVLDWREKGVEISDLKSRRGTRSLPICLCVRPFHAVTQVDLNSHYSHQSKILSWNYDVKLVNHHVTPRVSCIKTICVLNFSIWKVFVLFIHSPFYGYFHSKEMIVFVSCPPTSVTAWVLVNYRHLYDVVFTLNHNPHRKNQP